MIGEKIAMFKPGRLTKSSASALAVLLVALLLVALLLVIAGAIFRHEAGAAASAEKARVDAAAAGAQDVAQLFTYDYRTIQEQLNDHLALLTPEFATQYRTLVTTKVAPAATSGKLTTRTDVATSSVVSVDGGEAKLLMFLNQTSAKEGSSTPILTGSRVLVSMRLVSGVWKVAAIDPV